MRQIHYLSNDNLEFVVIKTVSLVTLDKNNFMYFYHSKNFYSEIIAVYIVKINTDVNLVYLT